MCTYKIEHSVHRKKHSVHRTFRIWNLHHLQRVEKMDQRKIVSTLFPIFKTNAIEKLTLIVREILDSSTIPQLIRNFLVYNVLRKPMTETHFGLVMLQEEYETIWNIDFDREKVITGEKDKDGTNQTPIQETTSCNAMAQVLFTSPRAIEERKLIFSLKKKTVISEETNLEVLRWLRNKAKSVCCICNEERRNNKYYKNKRLTEKIMNNKFLQFQCRL